MGRFTLSLSVDTIGMDLILDKEVDGGVGCIDVEGNDNDDDVLLVFYMPLEFVYILLKEEQRNRNQEIKFYAYKSDSFSGFFVENGLCVLTDICF